MKKTILKIFLFFLFLTILFLKPNTVKAQDLEVICDNLGDCTPSVSPAIFSSSTVWYPGLSLAKTIRIRNNHSTDTMTVSTNAQNPQIDSLPCQLDKQLFLSIVRVGAPPLNSFVWGGSLNNFYQQSSIPLAIFSPGSIDDFVFTVTLPPSIGDQCQNKTTSFDLLLNFFGETITPTSSPTSTITPTPTSAPGDDGGGAVLGASVSAPVCHDTKPGLPRNFAVVSGPAADQVTLSWDPPSAPYTYTYFLVAYSDSPDEIKWGNPNVGNGTSYIVSGLGPGTHYFWLRAGNGCMPGNFVGPVSPGAIAGVGTGGPAIGFVEDVLGVKKEEPEGEVGGGIATTAGVVGGTKAPICPFWWIVLLGQTLLLSGFYLWQRPKKVSSLGWLLTGGVVFLGFFLDRYAHTHWYFPSKVCPFVLWLGLGLAILQSRVFKLLGHRLS